MSDPADQSGISPTGANVLHIMNPATLMRVGDVRCHAVDDVQASSDLARSAQKEWASLPIVRRLEILHRAQDLLLGSLDEVAWTICQETGKPRLEALANDIMAGLSVGDYAIGAAPEALGRRKVHLGSLHLAFRSMGRSSFIRPRPIGVIGIIPPWNYPFGIPYSQTIMALAAGNAAIIKPSSYTPFSSLQIAKLFHDAGAPKGLVQVLVGPGASIGSAMVRGGLDRIIFTGSGKVGRDILKESTAALTPVTLELGGKDPLMVMDDADLGRAARAAAWGSFVNAGQTCAAVKRILVHEKVLPDFTRMLLENVAKLRLGWGWDDPNISMGPLIDGAAVADVAGMVQRAVDSGGKVLCGGRQAPGLNPNFYEPTIITDVDRKAEISQAEIFGPLVVLLPFTDPEDALQAARECPYALSGSIWTSDLKKGSEMASRMPGGSILVNNTAYSYGLGATPWGGSGESGYGRTHGDLGFLELLEMQHIHVDKGNYPRDVWWSPYDQEGLDRVRDMTQGLFGGMSIASLRRLIRVRKSMKK
jgi:acyl-CoA reductase-like NAD-dependent aldehyde dehydrogenase